MTKPVTITIEVEWRGTGEVYYLGFESEGAYARVEHPFSCEYDALEALATLVTRQLPPERSQR